MLLEKFKAIDLTHEISSSTPTWNGSCGFCLEIKSNYDQMFCVQKMTLYAGIGTHIDAPSHRFEKGLSVAQIPLEQLIVPACVIDVSKHAHADYEVSLQDIAAYEKRFGVIPQQALVVAHTGWNRFWLDPVAYRKQDAKGQMHFPAFSAQAAEFLLTRNIAGIAIDTLSPDCLDAKFTVHKLILGAGKYIIENLANTEQLPAQGAYVIALPLLVAKATESPMRVIGLVPRHNSGFN